MLHADTGDALTAAAGAAGVKKRTPPGWDLNPPGGDAVCRAVDGYQPQGRMIVPSPLRTCQFDFVVIGYFAASFSLTSTPKPGTSLTYM